MATSMDYNIGILGVKKPLDCSCQELLSTPKISLYGWLRKRALRNKLLSMSWPQVFVVVANECLYYFSSEMSKKPSGSFSLYGYNRICRASQAKVKDVLWAFKLEHIQPAVGSLYFSTSSEKDMVKWMRAIKQDMLSANGKNNRASFVDSQYGESIASEDSWGSCDYNIIETSIYEQADTCRPMSMQSDIGDQHDSDFEDDQALPKEEAPSLPQTYDIGYSVEKFIPNDHSPGGKEYWNSIRFDGPKVESSAILSTIAEDGVFLVRKSEDNSDVLAVYSGVVKKYKIIKANRRYSLSPTMEPSFQNLEDMLYHYYSNNLPSSNQKLLCPFKLHDDYHGYEGFLT